MAWTSSAGKRGIVLEKILAVIMATLLVVAMGGCASSGTTIDDEPTPMADTAGDVEADEAETRTMGRTAIPSIRVSLIVAKMESKDRAEIQMRPGKLAIPLLMVTQETMMRSMTDNPETAMSPIS